VTRHEARAQLATWRAIVDDTEAPHLRREAVAKLVAVCEWYAAEVERLEQISRLDVVHLNELGRTIRELREVMPRPLPPHPSAAPPVVLPAVEPARPMPWFRKAGIS
jgi:hypothetical protein